jgi:hypothetical protein
VGNRESISKKTRFEIFKRDNFTCQYCGRTSEDVVLEIDHIMPVSKGGANDETNLVPACFDCNRGKGNRELGNVIPRPDADMKYLETQQEIQELKRYKRAKAELDMLLLDIAEGLCDTWANAFQSDVCPKEIEFVKLLKLISPEIIEKAIYVTASNKRMNVSRFSDKWRYMCGVAWNIVKEGED